MSNQLQVYQGLAFGELTTQDITTIRETIAKDCNDSQFRLFMAIAKASGANPVMNEIYPTVRQGQLTVQFGIDFYVRKAKESEGYLGYDVQLVHENDEFQMHQERAEDGRYYMVIDKHSFGFPRGKVIGGYAIAYREGFKPFTVVMEVEEVEHFKKSQIGMQKTMWNNFFNDMFKKHMVRRALKAAFDLNFDDEQPVEMGSGIPEYQPRRKDMGEAEVVQPDAAPTNPEPEPEPTQKQEDDEETKIKKARAEMVQKFKQLGITSTEGMQEYIAKHAPIKGEVPTLAEMLGLLKIMDMHIAEQQAEQSSIDELV